MDKKIKDYIAEKKLSDDDIYKLLTAESTPAVKKEDGEQSDEESDVETESTTETQADEEDASDSTKEQPDMKVMIKEAIAEELGKMRRGKKPPKVVKTPKEPTKTVQYNFNQEFGEI